MTEQFLNDMYLIAIKSKLQRNSISTEEKLKIVLEELKSLSENVIVNTNGDNGVPSETEPHTGSASVTSTNVAPKEDIVQKKDVPELEITEKKFAQSPEEEGFLNRDLETSDDGQYYVIELTIDPKAAYFSLMGGSRISRELLQTPQFAPNFAVEFENSPGNDQSNLSIVKKGTLTREGRYWKIVGRCKAKWV